MLISDCSRAAGLCPQGVDNVAPEEPGKAWAANRQLEYQPKQSGDATAVDRGNRPVVRRAAETLGQRTDAVEIGLRPVNRGNDLPVVLEDRPPRSRGHEVETGRTLIARRPVVEINQPTLFRQPA